MLDTLPALKFKRSRSGRQQVREPYKPRTLACYCTFRCIGAQEYQDHFATSEMHALWKDGITEGNGLTSDAIMTLARKISMTRLEARRGYIK